jgi:hypothetical protein
MHHQRSSALAFYSRAGDGECFIAVELSGEAMLRG